MSARPYRFLRTEGAGGFTPPTAPKMSLPIRQRLGALTCLKAGPKLVLIEVCELAEHGTRASVTASNGYLATRLGLSERTVSRILVELGSAGLLEVRDPQGKGRQMLPTPAVRVVYTTPEPSADAVANLAKLSRFNLDKSGSGNAPNLDKSGQQPRQTRSTNLDKPGSQPRQTRSRVIGDDQDDQFNDQDDQLRAALAEVEALKKKLGEAQARALLAEARVDSLQATIAAHTEGGAVDVATSVPAAKPVRRPRPSKHDEPVGFLDLYALWPKQVSRQDAARAYDKLDFADRLAAIDRARAWLAKSPDVGRENSRYVPNLATWLNQKRWTDSFPEPTISQPHAPANQPFAQQARPVNGHKPAGHGGAMARHLIELE